VEGECFGGDVRGEGFWGGGYVDAENQGGGGEEGVGDREADA
jgi:hypothetical protein